MIRRRARWIAAAAAAGAAIGAAYMLIVSSAARDPLAGAVVGLVVGLLIAGWAEWGPRPQDGARSPAVRLVAGFAGGLAIGVLGGVVVFGAVVDDSPSDGTQVAEAGPEEPSIESAAGPDGTFDDRDLRRCLNGEMSTTEGSYWGAYDPTGAESVFVAGDRRIERDDRDWDRPPPDARATLFVYRNGKTARKAAQDVEESFGEIDFVERYSNVLVGLNLPLQERIDVPLKACLGAGEQF